MFQSRRQPHRFTYDIRCIYIYIFEFYNDQQVTNITNLPSPRVFVPRGEISRLIFDPRSLSYVITVSNINWTRFRRIRRNNRRIGVGKSGYDSVRELGVPDWSWCAYTWHPQIQRNLTITRSRYRWGAPVEKGEISPWLHYPHNGPKRHPL